MLSGRHEDLIKIIKTTYLRNKERLDNKKKITRLWNEKRTVEEWEISKYEEKALENHGDGSQDAFDMFCKQLFGGYIQV